MSSSKNITPQKQHHSYKRTHSLAVKDPKLQQQAVQYQPINYLQHTPIRATEDKQLDRSNNGGDTSSRVGTSRFQPNQPRPHPVSHSLGRELQGLGLITQVQKGESTPKVIGVNGRTASSKCAVTPLASKHFGIEIEPESKFNKLLMPQKEDQKGKKTLVLDLDETLVHSSFKPPKNPDIILPIDIEGRICHVYVLVRPGCFKFLTEMAKYYEVVIFTASLSKYAIPLMDILDQERIAPQRLFREHCTFHNGSFVKDMAKLGRPMKDIIIIDNSPQSYLFQPENGLPIVSWYEDPKDNALLDLIPVLQYLSQVPDVRPILLDCCTADNVYQNEKSIKKCQNIIKETRDRDLQESARMISNRISGANQASAFETQNNQEIHRDTTEEGLGINYDIQKLKSINQAAQDKFNDKNLKLQPKVNSWTDDKDDQRVSKMQTEYSQTKNLEKKRRGSEMQTIAKKPEDQMMFKAIHDEQQLRKGPIIAQPQQKRRPKTASKDKQKASSDNTQRQQSASTRDNQYTMNRVSDSNKSSVGQPVKIYQTLQIEKKKPLQIVQQQPIVAQREFQTQQTPQTSTKPAIVLYAQAQKTPTPVRPSSKTIESQMKLARPQTSQKSNRNSVERARGDGSQNNGNAHLRLQSSKKKASQIVNKEEQALKTPPSHKTNSVQTFLNNYNKKLTLQNEFKPSNQISSHYSQTVKGPSNQQSLETPPSKQHTSLLSKLASTPQSNGILNAKQYSSVKKTARPILHNGITPMTNIQSSLTQSLTTSHAGKRQASSSGHQRDNPGKSPGKIFKFSSNQPQAQYQNQPQIANMMMKDTNGYSTLLKNQSLSQFTTKQPKTTQSQGTKESQAIKGVKIVSNQNALMKFNAAIQSTNSSNPNSYNQSHTSSMKKFNQLNSNNVMMTPSSAIHKTISSIPTTTTANAHDFYYDQQTKTFNEEIMKNLGSPKGPLYARANQNINSNVTPVVLQGPSD